MYNYLRIILRGQIYDLSAVMGIKRKAKGLKHWGLQCGLMG